MYKCANCGTEFESKFCPECGTPAPKNGKHKCANCGTEFESKFCPECGTPAGQSKAPAPRVEQATPAPPSPPAAPTANVWNMPSRAGETAYGILTHVPAVLLMLFGILMPLLFIAPVVKSLFLIGNNSLYGAAYLGTLPTMSGVRISMLTVGFLTLAVGIATAVLKFATPLKNKYIILGDKPYFWHELTAYSSLPLYFVMFILACVTMSKISSADKALGGFGLIKAGAEPVTVLVFSLLWLLFAAGTYAALILLVKRGKDGSARTKRAAALAQYAQMREAILARLQDPAEQDRLKKAGLPGVAAAYHLAQFNHVSVFATIFQTVYSALLFLLLMCRIGPPLRACFVIGAIAFIAVVVVRIVWILRSSGMVYWGDLKKVQGIGGLITSLLFMLMHLAGAILCVGFMVSGEADVMISPLVAVFAVGSVISIANFIVHLLWRIIVHKLRALVWVKQPTTKNEQTPIEKSEKEEEKSYNSRSNSWEFSVEKLVGEYGAHRREIRLCRKYKIGHYRRSLAVGTTRVMAVMVSLALLFMIGYSVYLPIYADPYSVKFVNEVLNDSISDDAFKFYFGPPTVAAPQNNRFHFAKYSGKAAKYMKQIDQKNGELERERNYSHNEERAEQLEREIAELKEKMQDVHYKYLRVTKYNGDIIYSIELDTNAQGMPGDFSNKRIKSIRKKSSYSDDGMVSFYTGVEIFYTDGSYYYNRELGELLSH